MGKWIFLVLIALVVYLAIKRAQRKVQVGPHAPQLPEDMVACGQCGVNLPKSEAYLSHGRYFCCKDHGGPDPA